MRFAHQIMSDPVNGDTEIVNINGTEVPIADFLGMEPDYTVLPAGVKGINYIPATEDTGADYYSYDLSGRVIEAHVSAETLDGFLAKVETYKTHNTAKTEQEEVAYLAALPYDKRRVLEYPPYADYLDGIVKGDTAQVDKYIADCLAVKAKYPKP